MREARCLATIIAAWVLSAPLAVGADLKQDFQRGQFDDNMMSLFGAGAKKYVKREADGLHIVFPGTDKVNMVGVSCKPQVLGDFEVTVTYEVLHADQPQAGYGIGMTLAVVADNAALDNAAVAWRVYPKVGPIYGSDLGYYTPPNAEGKRQDKHNSMRFNDPTPRGKLRLARKGPEMLFLAAGDDGVFRQLRREPFALAPLKQVRVTADSGGGFGGLDIRLMDLHVHTDDAGPVPAVSDAPNLPTSNRPRGRLTAALVCLSLLMVAGGIMVWLKLRRRRMPSEQAASTRAKKNRPIEE
jgi:hypothetical protein